MVGGPIAQNKVFFFAISGGRQKSPPADAFRTVTPDEFRRGDFERPAVARHADVIYAIRRPGSRSRTTRSRPAASAVRRSAVRQRTLYPRPNVPAGARATSARQLRQQDGRSSGLNQFDVKDDRLDTRPRCDKLLRARTRARRIEVTRARRRRCWTSRPTSKNPFWEHRRELEPHHRHGAGQRPAIGYNDNELQQRTRPDLRQSWATSTASWASAACQPIGRA